MTDKPAGSSHLFEIRNTDDYSLIRFFDTLDADAVEKLRPSVQASLPENAQNIVIDLGKVDFLDSHGVGLFVSLLKTAHKNNGRLYIAAPDGQPASVLHMVGLNEKMVTYCDTAQEACDACARGSGA